MAARPGPVIPARNGSGALPVDQRFPYAAVLVGILLLFVYSLTYSGTFTTDDEHILASKAISLAFDGRLDDLRVFGNMRVFALSQLHGAQAAQAINVEPAQPVLGALLARLAAGLNEGRVQTLFLLNVWATALTAVIVFLAAGSLGYGRRAAFAAALLFGLGTQAWPYARSYFRDPLAALLLAFAWWKAIQIAGSAHRAPRSWTLWLELFAALGLGILAKNTVVLAVPAVIAVLLLRKHPKSAGQSRFHARTLIVFMAVFLALAGILFLLAARLEALSRFSLEYYLGMLRFFAGSSHASLAQALAGPLVSPGKSIFLYSPVLLLAIPALARDWRLAVPAWAYLLLLILGQGLFYGPDWWGHVNWGLRFVLPAIPPLVMASLPVIDRLLQTPGRRALLFSLGGLAIAVQLAGVLVPVREYYVHMSRLGPAAAGTLGVWDLSQSPILWSLRWLGSGQPWDLAAVRSGWPALAWTLGLFLPALASWMLLVRRRAFAWTVACLPLALLATLFLPRQFSGDPAYTSGRRDLIEVRAALAQDVQPGDLLAVNSYGSPAWYFWMNWGPVRPEWISLPYASLLQAGLHPGATIGDPQMDQFQTLLSDHLKGGDRIWLLLPCDSATSAAGVEALLEGQRARVSRRAFQDGNCTTTLILLTPP